MNSYSFIPISHSATLRPDSMLQTGDSVGPNPATAEDYLAWVEELLIYQGRMGLTSWESRPQDIAALTSVSDLPDAGLGQNDLDLNKCLGNAVCDAERGQWLEQAIKHSEHLGPRAVEILDKRIDQEISDPATVQSLKKPRVKLTQKLAALSKVEAAPPEYTVHLSATHPKGRKLSEMTGVLRSFRIPFTASFGDFVAKLNSESLAFRPKGHGVNSGYSLEDGAWLYCLLNGHGVVSKCKQIATNTDYSTFMKSLSPGLTDKVAIWHEACPPPSERRGTKMVVTSLAKKTGITQHASPPQGVTVEEQTWLANAHPIDIVDYAIELEDRGTRTFWSGNPTLGLKEYKRGLAIMSYLTKDPPSTQKLCNQIRATLHLNSALLLLELRCFEEAIASSSVALKVSGLTDRQMASAYYRRGIAYKGLSDELRALGDLAAAFKLSPHDASIAEKLDATEKLILCNMEPDIRQKYEKVKAGALSPDGTPDKIPKSLKGATLANALRVTLNDKEPGDYMPTYESVLSACDIQTVGKPKHLPKGACDAESRLNAVPKTLMKGDLGLPAGFWDDWTSDVNEDGEPLDKYGRPFFEPYNPGGIVSAVLKDPSFP
ncbi:hypothetical protein FGG08_001006 [Glutinoglossum americanum]|uniref:Uncharacterized protein n=1 Tax=Glutinoglossum americanum TaxID=1670608 RepID=A0A9P8IED3_9PEZI|nr:hypothetical protein FGG08_001006 [Glutinoglossum americanum]